MAVSAWAGPVTATTLVAPTEPSGLFAGAANVSALRVGTSSVSSVRLGSGQAWPTVTAPAAAALTYPADAGFIDVTAAPYNAVGDGIADDTAALLAAFTANDYKNDAPGPAINQMAPKTVYLPAGTYRVTDTIRVPGSSLRIIGAGKSLTTIKLTDNATGFGDVATPKHLLRTGFAFPDGDDWNLDNAGFANQIRDLTIDVGSGNAGAIGCRHSIANVGSMERVLIRSSDPGKLGARGLSFETNPGSGFVQDVEIDGFTYGIYCDTWEVNDLTFSDITLRNQLTNAIFNEGKSITVAGLTVVNGPATAIRLGLGTACLTLLGATIGRTGTGTAITGVANSFLHLRDVAVTGYTNIVTHNSVTRFSGRSSLTEWSTLPYTVGSTTTAWTESDTYKSLNLPVESAPYYDQTDLSKWRSVVAHGATGTNDADDDGPAFNAAIAAAIAAGQDTIYTPYGRYTIKSTVTIPTGIKKIDFCGSIIFATAGLMQLTTTGTVVLENVSTRGEWRTDTATGTVVFRHFNALNSQGANFTTGTACTSSTRIFIEDTGPHSNVNISRPASVWVRSWNRERAGTWSVTGGAKFWHIGQNVEEGGTDPGPMTQLVAADSQLEILGGGYDILDSNRWPTTGSAAHDFTNCQVAFMTTGNYGSTGKVDYWLRLVNGGTTYTRQNQQTALGIGASNPSRTRVVWPLYRSP